MNYSYLSLVISILCMVCGIFGKHRPSSAISGFTLFSSALHFKQNATEVQQQTVDTSLYSRQLFVYGKSAQMRLLEGKVVLVAEDEILSFEVAKNLALTGVGKIALYSAGLGQPSTKFRISGDDGSLSEYITALNSYVKVQNITFTTSLPYASLPNDLNGAVILICSNNLTTIDQWNQFARRNNAQTIAIYQKGKVGFVFDDFLDEFEVVDVEGEVFKEVFLSSTVKELPDRCLEIRSIDEELLGYGLGDVIAIQPASTSPSTHNQSFFNLTSLKFIVKEVINMKTVVIQPLPQEGDIPPVITLITSHNAIAQKQKSQQTTHHSPFNSQLLSPKFTAGNACLSPKQDLATNMILLSLLKVDSLLSNLDVYSEDYERKMNASLRMELRLVTNNYSDPRLFPPNKSHFKNNFNILVQSLYQSFLRSKRSGEDCCVGLTSVLGAIGAQEVVKAITHMYSPLSQFVLVESLDTVHPLISSTKSTCNSQNATSTRTVTTQHLEEKKEENEQLRRELAKLKVFIVGAGAIGCELLKNFALMGIGTSSINDNKDNDMSNDNENSKSLWYAHGLQHGGIIVTDPDLIERSNLNRQLLFRPKHIGQAKSLIAAQQVRKINPNINILPLTHKVGKSDFESQLPPFDESFWQEADIIVTALDNVEARLFVDSQCVRHKLWLVDSGTLGTKGNTQVIIPYLTESYGSGANDPPETALPVCTVKSFPYQPEHCVAWAKELFAATFNNEINHLQDHFHGNNEQELSEDDQLRLQENIATLHQPLQWAKSLFDRLFHRDVEELLRKHPPESVDEDDPNTRFWSGARRLPTSIIFNLDYSLHVDFIASAIYVRLRALNQLPGNWTFDTIRSKVTSNEEISSLFSSFVKTNDHHNKNQNQQFQFQPQSFEKDDLSLGHVHFVTSASNLRSRVYGLKEVDLLTAQGLAGKIIPALATTTALVAGLVSMEVVKIVSERLLLRSGHPDYFPTCSQQEAKGTSNPNDNEITINTKKTKKSIGSRIFNSILRRKQQQEQVASQSQSTSHKLTHTHSMQRLQADKERLLKRFRNAFVNLAVPVFSFTQPVTADTISSYRGQDFNLWHDINLELGAKDDISVEQLLDLMRKEYEVEVTAMMYEENMLFASFLPDADEIKQKSIKQLLLPLLPQQALENAGEDQGEVEDDDKEYAASIPSNTTKFNRRFTFRLDLSSIKAKQESFANTNEEEEDEQIDEIEVQLPPLVISITLPSSEEQISSTNSYSNDEDEEDSGEDDNEETANIDDNEGKSLWRKMRKAAKLVLEK